MEKFESQELLELVPTNVIENYNLTKKQSMLLGLFIVYNNLDQTKNNGFFYRSNKDICQDIDISEPTLITAITKLEQMELIERKTGNRTDGASEYKLNKDLIFNTKINTKNLSDNFSNNLSNLNFTEILGIIRDYQRTMNMVIELLLKSNTKNLSNNLSNNFSTDTESDIDTEIETDSIYNNILNNKLNIKKNTNNNINKNNNILEEVETKEEKETEVEEKVKEEKTEVEDTKTVQDDVNEFASEPMDDINETVEENEDDTKELSDDELKARLTKYFNENKDSITNETEYNEFETVFNMVLQNYVDNHQVTSEQSNHARLFTVLPLLSSLRGILLKKSKTEEKALSEPSKEETLTTIKEDKENSSEPKEMASDEEIYDAFGNDVKKEMEFAYKEAEDLDSRDNNFQALETECDAVFVNPMEVKIEVDTKKDEREELRKKCLARMKSLFSSASTKNEANNAFNTIQDGLRSLMEERKLGAETISNLRQSAWFMYTDTLKEVCKAA